MIGALVVFVPSNPVEITLAYILAFLVFGFPLLVLLAIVLPITAIVSLVRSYQEAGQPDLARSRVPIAMILLGQIAGGALALVFAPALTVVAPNSMALSVLTVIMWAFQLLTPTAVRVGGVEVRRPRRSARTELTGAREQGERPTGDRE